MLYSPVYTSENSKYVILEEVYTSPIKDEAIAKGIVGCLGLGLDSFYFSGEAILLDTLKCFPLKIETKSGLFIKVGLFSGKLFEEMLEDKKNNKKIIKSNINNDVYIIKKYTMTNEEKTESIVFGSGIDGETLRPYVVIYCNDKEYKITPNHAREMASDLFFMAEASESDSFTYQVVSNLEITDEDKKRFINNIREARQEFREFEAINGDYLTKNSDEEENGIEEENSTQNHSEADEEEMLKLVKELNKASTIEESSETSEEREVESGNGESESSE